MQYDKLTEKQADTNRSATEMPVSGLLCKSAESALYLAIKACGIAPGDYVLAPDLGSADLAGALRRTGALPILFDVDPLSWLTDLDLLEEFLMSNTMLNDANQLVMRRDGGVVKGIIAVHLNGNPPDMDRLRFIADRFVLPLIEDATESAGALFRSKPVGTFGETAALALSRHPAGYAPAGGLMLAHKEAHLLAAQAHHASLEPHEKLHPADPDIGTQLLHQQKQISREHLLEQSLSGITAICFQHVHPLAWRYSGALALETNAAPELQAFLEQHQILTASLAPPLHLLPSFRTSLYMRREDHATRLFEQVVVVPGLDLVGDEIFEKIAFCIKQFFNVL